MILFQHVDESRSHTDVGFDCRWSVSTHHLMQARLSSFVQTGVCRTQSSRVNGTITVKPRIAMAHNAREFEREKEEWESVIILDSSVCL